MEADYELQSVKDTRESRPIPQRRSTSRFITVDSVLQYASDIPSARQRQPQRPRHYRTGSGRPVDPRLTGRYAPSHLPPRSTKVSEKLVLLPETPTDNEYSEDGDFGEDNDAAPLRDDEQQRRPGREKSKSYAERLPKSTRTEKELARVTAYCTAQAYKLGLTAHFIRERHGARTKLYDNCLYTAYHLPLVPGTEGYRVQSSPLVKSAGGKAILDEAIERSEQRDYHGAYFAEEEEEHSVRGGDSPSDATQTSLADNHASQNSYSDTDFRRNSDHSQRSVSPIAATPPNQPYQYAEMFTFSYGVVVFWNFTEKQEKDILADLTFSSAVDPKTQLPSRLPLVTLALEEDDFETEEFHFEYNNEISRPRIYNDMITLRSGDHMIKLAISHAIAQSTKLSHFEETMRTQMEDAKHVPRRLAATGELGMNRQTVLKLLGSLFKSRVDVNLSSKTLDVPDFLWNDEPTLHPLYSAVREYLEIKPRIKVLNERCRVCLDLAEMLSDSIDDNKMSRQTLIIIWLIVLSIFVTCSEVFLRFGILTTKSKKGPGTCPPCPLLPMG
ncbi:MAG: hypothetical protein Q9227_000487 [Pyrenula ochraceoflavens]